MEGAEWLNREHIEYKQKGDFSKLSDFYKYCEKNRVDYCDICKDTFGEEHLVWLEKKFKLKNPDKIPIKLFEKYDALCIGCYDKVKGKLI